ncbi:hypothetical protein K505DRAFT_361947 [Melanomma pulvis-pyrius CBS 109.77]|uniref:DUF7730 domain-containing protein n=1 Tax=Melanomma pulvis-pyrius CBS 109.77 TaxID=1314802 RepID=A0A6A6XAQ3_9PLEO|nr:hypothetical protein K505DRAFT_361947 [Melanomma pulvis-pyrius CBS 109.77]
MQKALPILSGQSLPRDRDAPTFLNLHPELRNSVYDFLFTFTDPLIIVGDADRAARLCRYAGDRNHGLIVRRQSDDEGEPGPTNLQCAGIPGLSLMRTCRQVYSEAQSFLYNDVNNTFTFAVDKQHDSTDIHDLNGAFLETAMRWLAPMSRMSCLRKIYINLDLLCDTDCECEENRFTSPSMNGHIDLNPLLQVLWSQERPTMQVNFVQPLTWARLDPDPTTYTNANARLNSDPLPVSSSNLTAILKALGHSDELGFKEYRHAIAEVPVSRSGLRGAVLYKTFREHERDGHSDFCHEGMCLHFAKYFRQSAVENGTSHLVFDP